MNLYRQGDVLICEVPNIPDKAEALRGDGPIILAEGEVTGHHHAIALAERFHVGIARRGICAIHPNLN